MPGNLTDQELNELVRPILASWAGFEVKEGSTWRPIHARRASFPESVRHFLGGDDGRSYILPLTYSAVTATIPALEDIERENALTDRQQGYLHGLRLIVEDQLTRRLELGCAVPSASALIGVSVLATSGLAGIASISARSVSGVLVALLPAAVGILYLACAGLYFHASRPETWRLNNRAWDGSYMSEMAKEGGAGILMGFFCLGGFAPLVVVWNYFSNYLSDGRREHSVFDDRNG